MDTIGYKRLIFKDESGFLAYYQQATQYDSFGRPYKELYTAVNTSDNKQSSKWIRYTYQNGYQYQIIDDVSNAILRQINTVNARGQLLTAKSSYFTEENYTYDSYGLPSNMSYKVTSGPYSSATPFLQLGTSFNAQRGNLSFRTNSMYATYDNFTYDNLDRLTSYPNNLGVMVNQLYDDKGKITNNDIGTYDYTISNKPYQVSSITPLDQSLTSQVLNYYSPREQNVTYNVFKSPVRITEQGIENIDFEYNASNNRATMYYGSTSPVITARPLRKMYSEDGTMEIKRNIITNILEFTTYIGGDGYSAPLILRSNGVVQNYLYLHRDYQGSILAITSDVGQVLEKRYFDAWGLLMKYANSSGIITVPTTSSVMLLDRGYTGHEHMLSIGLINMNARLYDPKLHRFLQPDNFVQDPSNTQNYNRYAYVLNNPLRYTDPTGENWWDDNWKSVVTVVAAVATAVVIVASMGTATPLVAAMWAGAGAGFVGGTLGTALNGGTLGQSLSAGFTGAITGAFFGVAGAYISISIGAVGIIPGMLSGTATSTTLGALSNIMFGNDWDAGLGLTAALGAVGGGYSGLSAAKASGAGIWFGTAAKPSVSVIAGNINKSTAEAQVAYDKSLRSQAEPINMGNTSTQDQVSAFAKENNLFSGQKFLGDKSIVESYLNKMNNGTFDIKSGAAGFEYNGKTIFTDGNHRMNAAIQFKLNTGNSLYINSLKINGNFTLANPYQYGYKIFPFPTFK